MPEDDPDEGTSATRVQGHDALSLVRDPDRSEPTPPSLGCTERRAQRRHRQVEELLSVLLHPAGVWRERPLTLGGEREGAAFGVEEDAPYGGRPHVDPREEGPRRHTTSEEGAALNSRTRGRPEQGS